MSTEIIELYPSNHRIKQQVRKIPVSIIIPPSTFLADERVFPFLGALKVAGELERNGNPVEVLDLSSYSNYEQIAATHARSSEAKIFALTATTPQIPAAARIAKSVREAVPNARLILGGPHATLTHIALENDIKRHRLGRGTQAFDQIAKIFDVIIDGDGEEAIFPAIDPTNTEKVIAANSIDSPLFLQRGTLENYSWPARHLIDLNSYNYHIDGHRATSLIVQLGCPFGCGFCGGRLSPNFRTTRTRSTQNAIAEMEEIHRNYGYTGFMFYDDELNVTPNTLETLCHETINLQEKLGVEFRLRGFVKAELFTPEQARLMYQAGFRMLLSGVESGSRDMLKIMRKGTTPETNQRCLTYAQDAGIGFKALMSIGHPGESAKTIAESVEWALRAKPNDIDWTIITEYPGSPYFDQSEYNPEIDAWVYQEAKTGHKLYSRSVDYTTQSDYYKGVPGDYTAFVWTDSLSSHDLVRNRDQAEAITKSTLKLPPVTQIPTLQYEHSMGQSLPSHILRQSLAMAV